MLLANGAKFFLALWVFTSLILAIRVVASHIFKKDIEKQNLTKIFQDIMVVFVWPLALFSEEARFRVYDAMNPKKTDVKDGSKGFHQMTKEECDNDIITPDHELFELLTGAMKEGAVIGNRQSDGTIKVTKLNQKKAK